MLLISILILLVLFILLAITGINLFVFPRLGAHRSRQSGVLSQQRSLNEAPLVSVLIPARNEAATISRIIHSLAAQSYPNYEVLILNDQSTDNTHASAGLAIGDKERFRLFMGDNLPDGWLGKNFACHQLSQMAAGDFYLFIDADVTLHPSAIQNLVDLVQSTHADLLTVWPTQITYTWGERLIVPLMALAVIAYLPLPAVHHLPWSSLAAANGQCLLFTSQAYHQIGGHQSVRGSIIEDVTLAKKIKKSGLKLRMADGNNRIICRMYTGTQQTIDGFAKNILAGHANNPFFLLLSTAFHLIVFVFPWIWLILGIFSPEARYLSHPYWPWLLVITASLSIFIRGLTAAATHQRIRDAVFLPISVLLMTCVAAKALWRHLIKADVSWKGRSIPNSKWITK
jgi:chlorobactene glucosyltransferase